MTGSLQLMQLFGKLYFKDWTVHKFSIPQSVLNKERSPGHTVNMFMNPGLEVVQSKAFLRIIKPRDLLPSSTLGQDSRLWGSNLSESQTMKTKIKWPTHSDTHHQGLCHLGSSWVILLMMTPSRVIYLSQIKM